ncbi:MAG: D-glycero-beta-D-manno-heptose-7-phosphate kinase [Nitrospirae bacterium]|nr:D-glycero-beta-D-manno-heptose-7-phosphate kinase [Nitrospirota bacterium]
MIDLIKQFHKTGILVIGDLMVDRYVMGRVNRISPEAPVPVVEVIDENLLLGGASNVANNIASLGGRVFVSGIVGRDEMGRVLIHKFREKEMDTEGIVVEGDRPTIVKTRIIAHNQQVVRFDKEVKSDISQSSTSLILDHVRKCLPEIKAIILSDYCKGVITRNMIEELLKITGSKVFVAVDPKVGHFDYYKGVSFITPNVNEASAGSGIEIKDEASLIKAGDTLLKNLQCKAVLITRGDEGMSFFEPDGKVTHIPTFARQVYDVTGAGDTVIAVFTLCHAAGADMKDAAIYANHAAGVVVGELGTAVVTPDDIIRSIKLNKKEQKT